MVGGGIGHVRDLVASRPPIVPEPATQSVPLPLPAPAPGCRLPAD
jgi:hypothetical protein